MGGQGQSHLHLNLVSFLTSISTDLILAVDTGSSDLWVHTPNIFKITSKTDVAINLSYGIGSASGKVVYGPIGLGGFLVPEQGEIFLYGILAG